jgi:predicted Zn-dependent protease
MTRGELAQVEVQVASRAIMDEAPHRVHAVALKRFAFDRGCEMAADGYAIKLLQDAGLEPAGLPEYLRTLPAQQGEDLAVYPAPGERIAAAQKAITVSGGDRAQN